MTSSFDSGGPSVKCNNCGCFLGEHLATMGLQPTCPAHTTTRKELVDRLLTDPRAYEAQLRYVLWRMPMSELAEVVEDMVRRELHEPPK